MTATIHFIQPQRRIKVLLFDLREKLFYFIFMEFEKRKKKIEKYVIVFIDIH